MVLAPRKRDATLADLDGLPEHLTGEILHGELFAHARPASPHVYAASRLGQLLGGAFERGVGGPGGWIILDEPELHLGPRPDVLVPDLAGWKRERMPRRPETPYFPTAPDFVCELMSPSTRAIDRVLKLPICLRERVGHVWLADPVDRIIEVFRREDDRWILADLVSGEAPRAIEPFGAIELDLAYLWSE